MGTLRYYAVAYRNGPVRSENRRKPLSLKVQIRVYHFLQGHRIGYASIALLGKLWKKLLFTIKTAAI